MRRLYPVPGTADHPRGPQTEAGLATPLGLAAAYAYPERAAGPCLRANMVSSLDGAARYDGKSAPLSSESDKRVFGVLRALADVILVGAETARQEEYGPARARAAFAAHRAADGQPPAPAIAVLSRSLDLDFRAPLFTRAATPTLVVTGAAAPGDRLAAARAAGARVVIAGDGPEVEPGRVVRELAALGFLRLLHEGGPRLLAQFAAAGVLDELCWTIAPVIAGGDAPRIMNGAAVAGPARFVPLSVLEEDGFLFTRYVRG